MFVAVAVTAGCVGPGIVAQMLYLQQLPPSGKKNELSVFFKIEFSPDLSFLDPTTIVHMLFRISSANPSAKGFLFTFIGDAPLECVELTGSGMSACKLSYYCSHFSSYCQCCGYPQVAHASAHNYESTKACVKG